MSSICLRDVLLAAAHGLHALVFGLGVLQRGRRFQREFGIDDQRAVVRHVDAQSGRELFDSVN